MQEKLEQWAKEQWQDSDLGDTRRNKRAIKIAASLMANPASSLPLQLEDWKDLKAAYRFLNTEKISHKSLLGGHHRTVRK